MKFSFLIFILLYSSQAFADLAQDYIDRGLKANYILIEKQYRRMSLFRGLQLIKTYKIALGQNPVGAKEVSGDSKTPEGHYKIDYKKKSSDFYLALRVSYPNAKQKRIARKKHQNPGGSIMIHGLHPSFKWAGKFHAFVDWTDGCIAVSNEEIEEIWKLVPTGAGVTIIP